MDDDYHSQKIVFWAGVRVDDQYHTVAVRFHPWQVHQAIRAVLKWKDQGLLDNLGAAKLCYTLTGMVTLAQQ